jgi:hypothetical protein
MALVIWRLLMIGRGKNKLKNRVIPFELAPYPSGTATINKLFKNRRFTNNDFRITKGRILTAKGWDSLRDSAVKYSAICGSLV